MTPQPNFPSGRRGSWMLAAVAVLGVTAFAWLLSGQQGAPGQSGDVATQSAAVETAGYPGPGPDGQTPDPLPATPLPATPLPEVGIGLQNVEDLGAKSADLRFAPAGSPQFVNLATDGAVVTGLSVTSGKPGVFGQVSMIDLTTNTVSTLAEVADIVSPRVSASYVIWSDQGRLSVYDRKSQALRELKLDGLARDPDLSGTVVVWENLVNDQTTGLVAYDLSTGTSWEVIASTPDAKAYRPQVSGDWVVFESWSLGQDGQLVKTLKLANLKSREVMDLAKLPTIQGQTPVLYAISSPWVVWAEWGGTPGLQLYNVETKERREAKPKDCSANGFPGSPSALQISGSIVIFSGCYQPMGYRLDDGAFFTVPVLAQDANAVLAGWALVGERLVWSQLSPAGDARETDLYVGLLTTK